MSSSKFNVVDSVFKDSDMPVKVLRYQLVRLLLAHGSNFDRMPFVLPPITHMGTGLVVGVEPQFHHLNH